MPHRCELVTQWNDRRGKQNYCKLANFPEPPEKETIVPAPPDLDNDRSLGLSPLYDVTGNRLEGTIVGWSCYWNRGSRKFGDSGAHHFDFVDWPLGRDKTGPVESVPNDHEGREHHHYRCAYGITL